MAKKDISKADLRNTLKDRIIDFVNDTVTLDVLTLTGTIELKPEKKTADGKDTYEFNWDDIFKNIAAKLSETTAEVEVVAYTHAEWDQDSVNYLAKSADAKLEEAHGKTVGAAHEARMNALKAAAEAVEKLF